MASFFILPLATFGFVTGLIVAAIILFFGKNLKWKWPAALSALIGCMVLFPAGIFGLSGLLGTEQDADQDRFEEIFGYATSVPNERMLSNHSGSGQGRSIFLRIEATDGEKEKILNIPGRVKSHYTTENIIADGANRGFSWWLRDRGSFGQKSCTQKKISDANGHNGWSALTILECFTPETHTSLVTADQVKHTSYLYIIAKAKE